jgi:hypothetical protein
VIKQAVLLSGCHPLHFGWRLGSAGSIMGSAHSRIFGSGGEMRLRVDPPFFFFMFWWPQKTKKNILPNLILHQVKNAHQNQMYKQKLLHIFASTVAEVSVNQ